MNLTPEKQRTKIQYEKQIAYLESQLTNTIDRLSHAVYFSYLQIKQDKKSAAIIRNKIKGLKKSIKLLGQLDLF